MLRVTPVYGSNFDDRGPSTLGRCTLIEYGGVSVLFNVGWNGDHQQQTTKNSTASPPFSYPYHDALIISDGCLESMGGLPMYYKQQQEKRKKMSKNGNSSSSMEFQNKEDDDNEEYSKPVMYATFPTVKMGQMMLYDHHAALCMDGIHSPFTLEELDEATSSLQTIKYSQTVVIPSRETGEPALSITAQRAGHAVGGAFFVLQRLRDETVVVVTSTYHVARELHLDSSTLLQYGATPDVLVTQPGGPAMSLLSALYGGVGSKKLDGTIKEKPLTVHPVVTQSRKTIVEAVLGVLRREGNVLLPVDASSRVLELLLVLNQHWDRHRLAGAYNLIWVGPMVHNTIEFARCQLEWMASPLGAHFDSLKGHPYALKHVTMFVSMNELEDFLADNQYPCCVLASGLSLDHGCARDVFLRWADNPDHAIIFTDSSQASLRSAYHYCNNASESSSSTTGMGNLGTNAVATENDIRRRMMATTSASAVGPTAAVDETTTDDVALVEEEAMLVGSTATTISKWSTAGQLLRHWIHAKVEGREMADMVEVDVLAPRRVPLAGAELQSFLKKEELTRLEEKKIEEQKAMLREVELAKGRLRLGDNEEEQEVVTIASTTMLTSSKKGNNAAALGSSSLLPSKRAMTSPSTSRQKKKKSRFDSSLFIKFSKPLHLTFEIREEAVGIGQKDSTAKYGIGESVGRSGEVLEDEYGIAVVSDFFQDIVTGVDPSKFSSSGRLGGGGGGDAQKKNNMSVNTGAYGYQPPNASGNITQSSGAAVDGEEDITNLEESETALEAQDLSEGNGIIRGRYGRPPMKVSTVVRTIEVLAEINYIPLEGRGDARSARQSVRALQPRQVVILGGGKASEDKIMTDIESSIKKDKMQIDNKSWVKAYNEVSLLADTTAAAGIARAFSPSNGEIAELSVGHAAYAVRLIDTPYLDEETRQKHEQALIRQQQQGYLHEKPLGACTVSRFDFVGTGRRVAADNSIVLAPPPPISIRNNDNNSTENQDGSSKPKSILVSDGDVLLTDLRAELTAQGMKAEYRVEGDGMSKLLVNGKIIVTKKTSSSSKNERRGNLVVEGPLCEDFYTVRGVVCGQFVTL